MLHVVCHMSHIGIVCCTVHNLHGAHCKLHVRFECCIFHIDTTYCTLHFTWCSTFNLTCCTFHLACGHSTFNVECCILTLYIKHYTSHVEFYVTHCCMLHVDIIYYTLHITCWVLRCTLFVACCILLITCWHSVNTLYLLRESGKH